MMEIRQTEHYSKWFEKLKDRQARARIDIRIRRLSLGNQLIILLAGGDKTTQNNDIQKAKELAKEIEV
jgi:putative component of toxin-antitoxin plasmid stabilization module